jgi:hypothetical protein
MLVVAGGAVIWRASEITKTDLSRTFEDRRASIQAQLKALNDRDDAIAAEVTPLFKKCNPAFAEFFRPWSNVGMTPDDHAYHPVNLSDHIPTGDEIVVGIKGVLALSELRENKLIGIQLSIGECGGPDIFFVLPREKFDELLNATAGQVIFKESSYVNKLWDEHKSNIDKKRFLVDINNQIYGHMVEAQATGGAASGSEGELEKVVAISLIQTTVTRFGVLSILLVLIGILTSLYRYNMRLASFYTARADLLLMVRDGVSVDQFSVLANALTPQASFGKLGDNPIPSLLSVLGAVKTGG